MASAADMLQSGSRLPRKHLEKRLGPVLRLAFLKIQLAEARRCEADGLIGSPRVRELQRALLDEEDS